MFFKSNLRAAHKGSISLRFMCNICLEVGLLNVYSVSFERVLVYRYDI